MRGATPCIKAYPTPRVRLTRCSGGQGNIIIGLHQKEPDPKSRISPERTLEPAGCQRRVSRRVLDIAMPQMGLQRPRIGTVIG
jgi:hypothetical protein